MSYYMRPFTSDELYHHGIKGMKWGHRKYQNVDGSLTQKGEKKYGTVENYKKAVERKKKIRRGIAIAAGTAVALALISNYMGGSAKGNKILDRWEKRLSRKGIT